MYKVTQQYLDKISEGDENAFRYIIEHCSMDLYYYAMGYVSSREDAEEIVSDVFLDLWMKKEKLAEINHIEAWLLTLVRNKSISVLRVRKEELFVSIDELDNFVFPDLHSPDIQLINKEETAEINRRIRTLPPKCKEVFFLAKIEQMPYKDIASMLGISVKTINIHIAKAMNIIGMKKK